MPTTKEVIDGLNSFYSIMAQQKEQDNKQLKSVIDSGTVTHVPLYTPRDPGKLRDSLAGVAPVPNTPIYETATIDVLRKKMLEIQAIADPGQKFNEIAMMQGTVAGYLNKRESEVTTRAQQETGVLALRKQLEDNIRMDRASPAYVAKYGNVDSDETAQVRQQYQSALAASTQLSEKYIKDNPEIAAVKAEFDSFLNINSQIAAKEYERAAKLKEYGDGIREIATWIDPKVTEDGIISGIAKYQKLLELKESPPALVKDVAEGKTSGAPIILAQAQAKQMAGEGDISDPVYKRLRKEALDKATDQVRTIQLITTDGGAFQTALSTFIEGAQTPEELADVKELKNSLKLAQKDPKVMDEFRQDFALRFIARLGKNEFLGNVDSWKVKDDNGKSITPFQTPGSPLQLLYNNVKKDTPIVSVASLVNELRKLPKEQQPFVGEQLKTAMRGSLQFASGGYFGRFTNSMNVESYVDQEIARQTLSAIDIFSKTFGTDVAIGTGIGASVGVLPSFLTGGLSIPAGAGIGAGIGAVIGAGSGVYDVLNSEGAQ